jgi:glycosyltransferase involved in cell wall biosynthesis
VSDRRILAFAYACEPEGGSEPGAGWAWSRILAGLGETWVVTRANNRAAIEARLDAIPERDRLHFVYVDLPPWARFWKRGHRGIRLYYMLWQAAALRSARRLHERHRFDLVWHVTLANAWLGSLAPLVGPPFVYGPVGGGIGLHWRLLPSLGARGTVYELGRTAARLGCRFLNPVARLSWRRSRCILVQNPETRGWLPHRYRDMARILPNVALEDDGGSRGSAARSRRGPPTAMYAGRLLPLKGVALAIRAMGSLPGWRLLLCGTGWDEARLRDIARRSGVDDRVRFLGHLARADVLRLMTDQADVFIFPSLHDEGPWAVAEALASGLPVVSLDVGGPIVLGSTGVEVGWPLETARRLADAARRAVPPKDPPRFDLASRTRELISVLDEAGLDVGVASDDLGASRRPPAPI